MYSTFIQLLQMDSYKRGCPGIQRALGEIQR